MVSYPGHSLGVFFSPLCRKQSVCSTVLGDLVSIYCGKCEITVDHCTKTRWSKKFRWGGRNLNDHARSDKPKTVGCPVRWGCKIHWLHRYRWVRSPPNECPDYDTKQFDGVVPVMLELWGMQSTPSLPSLPGRGVAPDSVLCIGQIELTAYLC